MMQSSKKTVDKKSKRETSKDDLSTKKPEEKLKKSVYSVSTPRNFIQKSTTTDIYAKNGQVKAPKKAQVGVKNNNVSPMKDLLKSSPSSVSNRSLKTKSDIRTPNSARPSTKQANNTSKKVLFNVTVNSPLSKRKDLATGKDSKTDKTKKDSVREDLQIKKKTDKKEEDLNKEVLSRINVDMRNVPERKRTKTRTLEDEEIKVLTPEVVENNTEMLNLTKKLKAQSKAFFVDLNEDKKELREKKKEKSSDEEVSYEDDFESYESDFDSYQSETKSDEATTSDDGDNSDGNNDDNSDENYDDIRDKNNDTSDKNDNHNAENDENSKEERMLDSGNFELRDPRSATKSKPMDFITEDLEEEQIRADDEGKKVSLDDEGFQDMSSGLSSMKTVHVDVLERPLFIDFTKSKENRRKRRIFEKLKQRAQIILSMVTLHEMSYNLFEMAPIPYDLYMATFGRLNYKQTAVQTFDDGITEEVQTDEVLYETKWTQNPVEFSNEDIYLNESKVEKDKDSEQFTFFTNELNKNEIISDSYKRNPLRIYLEQKDGVGLDAMLPYQSYELKLKNNTYSVKRLKKFLKNIESRVSNILNINAGITDMSNIVKTSKIPYSNGYVSISTNKLEEKASFLKDSKIVGAIFSETKNNLILSVHEKSSLKSVAIQKCVLCLWDLSMTKREPIKYLIATDNVKIGRFSGGTDGYFVGALEDGSIHLWDLSEEATWCNLIEENSTKMVEINLGQTKNLTQTEKDREWNNKNSHLNDQKQQYGCPFQASAYTSSGYNICNNESIDGVVGLEFLGEHTAMNMGNGRKIIRQLCSLQRNGVLTTWSIIYEKTKTPTNDIGKAFWSKMYLERSQTTNLSEYLDVTLNNIEPETDFNLNSAKKRLMNKRQEKNFIKSLSRQKSLSKFDSDRPNSAASVKNKRIMVENSVWDGVECCHLKIMNLNNVDNFLVGKNCGEVLCCRRRLGTMIIKRLNVANCASSITSLEASPYNLPHFLAASDCGTVSLCSLLDLRVLLTLDCRNGPTSTIDKYQTDHKGRFLGTVAVETPNFESNKEFKSPILGLCHTQPLSIVAVYRHNALIWDLKNSDSKVQCACAATACVGSERNLALLTPEGDIQVYKLTEDKDQIELFNTYVALL